MSYPTYSSAFEEWLAMMQKQPQLADFQQALTDVADTAHACKLWFESRGLAATAADVMTMTRMVLDREATAQVRKSFDEAD